MSFKISRNNITLSSHKTNQTKSFPFRKQKYSITAQPVATEVQTVQNYITKASFSSFLYNQYVNSPIFPRHHKSKSSLSLDNNSTSHPYFAGSDADDDDDFFWLNMNKFKIDFNSLYWDYFKFTDRYKPLSILGEGAFGLVIRAIDLYCNVNPIKAVKIIDKTLHPYPDSISEEYQILKELNSRHVIKVYDVVDTKKYFFIFMEYIKDGTLKDWMIQRYFNPTLNYLFSEKEVSSIVRGLIKGVEVLHVNSVIHRDIKPENIWIRDVNDLSTIVWCDFGMYGTLIYMAPEIVNNTKYNHWVDLFSCGIILYFLLSGGRHPLYGKGENKDEFKKRVQNNEDAFSVLYDITKNITETKNNSWYGWNLVSHLCTYNPFYRYDHAHALHHPFLDEDSTRIPVNDNLKSQLLCKLPKLRAFIGFGLALNTIKKGWIYKRKDCKGTLRKTTISKVKVFTGFTLPKINLVSRKKTVMTKERDNAMKWNEIVKRGINARWDRSKYVHNFRKETTLKIGKICYKTEHGCLSLKKSWDK